MPATPGSRGKTSAVEVPPDRIHEVVTKLLGMSARPVTQFQVYDDRGGTGCWIVKTPDLTPAELRRVVGGKIGEVQSWEEPSPQPFVAVPVI